MSGSLPSDRSRAGLPARPSLPALLPHIPTPPPTLPCCQLSEQRSPLTLTPCPLPILNPVPLLPGSYLDYYSIMGWSYVLSCPAYPQMAQLLPATFRPTLLPGLRRGARSAVAASMQPGVVSSWKLAPEWSRPTAGGGMHAVSKRAGRHVVCWSMVPSGRG